MLGLDLTQDAAAMHRHLAHGVAEPTYEQPSVLLPERKPYRYGESFKGIEHVGACVENPRSAMRRFIFNGLLAQA